MPEPLPNIYEKQREFALANPVEKNFDLLRCRNYIEALDGPVSEIAEGGEKNVPFLLSKIDEVGDENQQESAIYVLLLIDSKKRLSNRDEVISKIETSISKMKKVGARNSSEKWLNVMKSR